MLADTIQSITTEITNSLRTEALECILRPCKYSIPRQDLQIGTLVECRRCILVVGVVHRLHNERFFTGVIVRHHELSLVHRPRWAIIVHDSIQHMEELSLFRPQAHRKVTGSCLVEMVQVLFHDNRHSLGHDRSVHIPSTHGSPHGAVVRAHESDPGFDNSVSLTRGPRWYGFSMHI